MKCTVCDGWMKLTTRTEDYFDPRDSHGHGQYDIDVYECTRCDNTEPAPKELDEDDMDINRSYIDGGF